jgi:uncharacterized protein Yka (UPF0111/DUF47 family)
MSYNNNWVKSLAESYVNNKPTNLQEQLDEQVELNEQLFNLIEVLCEELGIDVEDLLEVSLKKKISAYRERAKREFESDSDDPKDFTQSGESKADRTRENILKHHGPAAATHADRAAYAEIFGRKYGAFAGPSVPAKGGKIVKKETK